MKAFIVENIFYRLSEKSKDGVEIMNDIPDWPCLVLLDIVQHWIIKDPTICFCTATQVGQNKATL